MAFRPLPWGAVGLLLAALPAYGHPTLDYLYIEANSGTSSGGHVAVRLNETVYHFQNKDGLILLQRDRWPRFQHLYADLDNRDIHIAKAAIPAQDQTEIQRHLDVFHLKQKTILDQADALDRDLQLLEALRLKHPFTVPGAGFFLTTTAGQESRRPILEIPGGNAVQKTLQDQLRTISLKRKNLQYPRAKTLQQDPEQSTFSREFADEWTDLLQGEIALDIVLHSKRINPAFLLEGGAIASAEAQGCSSRDWLTRYRNKLENDAVNLLLNPYPGSGLPLLRALARLEAVKESLDSGKLLFLAPSLASSPSSRHEEEYLAAPQSELELEFQQHLVALSRLVFCSSEVDDLAYHTLELAALDLREAVRANTSKIAVQFDHEPGLPNAPSALDPDAIDGYWLPDERDLAVASNARDLLRERLIKDMHYNLITRNCVTELIRAMYKGFESDKEPASFKGHIDPMRSQSFVPFRFFELVLKRYPIEGTMTIPSYRHRRMAELEAQGRGPWLRMLEGNTLTGSLYHPRDEDGVFLFFTDETLWSRPLLGAANLGTAVGAMALGLAALPLDSGRLLEAGARGALFSLPEIALWNIRKGSYTEATLRE